VPVIQIIVYAGAIMVLLPLRRDAAERAARETPSTNARASALRAGPMRFGARWRCGSSAEAGLGADASGASRAVPGAQ
jgi:hypothetical protein